MLLDKEIETKPIYDSQEQHASEIRIKNKPSVRFEL